MNDKVSSNDARYARQMIMPQIGSEGQRNLSNSKVLIIGAGGIGSTVAMYLAASGVPADVLDFDLVEVSNLHRQIIHDESQTGKEKAASAVEHMTRINSSVAYQSLICKLTSDNAMDIISRYDLVVDATDNIDARYTINDCCVLLRKPFISGSSVSMDGQITTVIPYNTPCYRCLYPQLSVSMGSCRSCADAGVLGPIPGLIGCLEAIEAMKLLLNRDKYINPSTDNAPTVPGASSSGGTAQQQRTNGKSAAQLKPLLGRQVQYDAVSGEFHTFKLPPRNIHCSVCGDHPTITSMELSKASLHPVYCTVPQQRNAEQSDPSAITNTVTPSLLAPVLLEANRVSAQALAEVLRVANASDGISLIVDVRSAEQFSIASLQDPTILSFSTLSECVATLLDEAAEIPGEVRAVQVSVPLSELRGGRLASERETSQSTVLQRLHSIRATLQSHNDRTSVTVTANSESLPHEAGAASTRAVQYPSVFVLCRRGIDSVTGTQLLLNNNFGPRVFNVEGGLTAWSKQVDTNFTMY